ncbi:15577_t:CDS:1, partial [Racocetra persica]
ASIKPYKKRIVRRNFKARCARVTKKNKRTWSACEKLMIIAYYKKGRSKRSTAYKFQIEPKQLRNWITKKSDLMKAASYIQKLSHGARLRYPKLEAELIEWFRDLRSQQKVVSQFMIQAKACSLCATSCYQNKYEEIA